MQLNTPAQVDGDHAVEISPVHIGGFRHGDVNAGIVESRVEAAESRHRLPHQGGHVRLIAANADSLVTVSSFGSYFKRTS